MANKNKKNQIKNQRCLCCKEIGHLAADCPRDPNFKTFELIEGENSLDIDLQNLITGLYTVKVTNNDNSVQYTKLLKQ